MCKQPCSVYLTPQYTENPQNICKEVFTNTSNFVVRNFHGFNASRWFPHMLAVTTISIVVTYKTCD